MDGLMMDYQLTLPKILERGRRWFPDREIVSKYPGGLHRTTYRDFYPRVLRLMDALRALGVQPGERVGSFAWNHHRHMELYYAVPALGAVLHTINIRLSQPQLRYIINHAEDRTIFVDSDLAPLLLPLQGELSTVKRYVVMGAGGPIGDHPNTDHPNNIGLEPALDYEELLAAGEEREDFPELRESDACMLCYTSGTTGDPKGVLYSHRAQYLQCMIGSMTDNFQFSERDTLLAIAPMFHVNGWGLAFLSAMNGTKLVFPGPEMDAAALVHLIRTEGVTFTVGVPAIWHGILAYLREHGGGLERLERVLIGGAPVPQSLIQAFAQDYGVKLGEAWGMTETAPPGRPLLMTSKIKKLPEAERRSIQSKSGTQGPCEEIRLVDEAGNALPWDGETMGELCIRGSGIAAAYYNNPEASQAFSDGWLHTGDIVTIDRHGNYQIKDRAKDLIKSGGEWISSVALENAIMACPGITEAAVVGRADERWDERPVAFVVPENSGSPPPPAEILKHIAPQFAKWQLPAKEDIRFVAELPKTSVGKFDKRALRSMVG